MAPKQALTHTSRISWIKRDTQSKIVLKHHKAETWKQSSKSCIGITDRAALRRWTVGHVPLPVIYRDGHGQGLRLLSPSVLWAEQKEGGRSGGGGFFPFTSPTHATASQVLVQLNRVIRKGNEAQRKEGETQYQGDVPCSRWMCFARRPREISLLF